MYYSPVRHSPSTKQAWSCCRSTCMCKACRQRSIWAMIKLFSLIHCLSHLLPLGQLSNIDWHCSRTDLTQRDCFVLSSMSIVCFKSKLSFRLATYAHTYRLLIVNVQFFTNHLGDLIADLPSAEKRDYEALFSIRQVIFYKQLNFFTTHKATSETSQTPVSLTALAVQKRDYEHFR